MSRIAVRDARSAPFVYYDIELDDARLNVWEHRAYCRVARRCAGNDQGECWESLEQMAAEIQMSRPTLVRALKTLIQRAMIRRISRAGSTSVYALLDKSNWLSFEAWKQAEAGKPENHPLVNHRTTPGKPENHRVVTTEPPPGKPESHRVVQRFTTKKTHEENTEEIKAVERAGARTTAPPLENHSDAFTVNGHGLAVDEFGILPEWSPLEASLAAACLWDRVTATRPRIATVAEAARKLLAAHPQPDLEIVRQSRAYYAEQKKFKFRPDWIAQDYALIREWCERRPPRQALAAAPLVEADDATVTAELLAMVDGYFTGGQPPVETLNYLGELRAQFAATSQPTPGQCRVLARLNEVLDGLQRAA